jgi:hypothetical protein
MSSQRSHSSQKSPTREKTFVPPVPALPKHSHQPENIRKQEQGYGYRQDEHRNDRQYDHYNSQTHHYGSQSNHYAPQPAIETEQYPAPASAAPVSLADPISTPEDPPKSSKSSRSAARIAAAEKAAEAAHGDINTRYQPKKPSPLAIKAAEERALKAGQTAPGLQAHRQVSGEWGVALGSPNNDGTFAHRASYSNDPYLNNEGSRGKSGVYALDPYAAYHGGDEAEEPQPEEKKNRWI